MKKEELLQALVDSGIEIAEEKKSEFIGIINKFNGTDIAKYKTELDNLKTELDSLKEKSNLYTDYEDLKKFKTETEQQKVKEVQTKNILNLLNDDKYKFDKKAINLLALALKEKGIEFDEQNNIKNADDIMATMQTEYADYILKDEVKGAVPSTTNNSKTDITITVEDFKKMGYKKLKDLKSNNRDLYDLLEKQAKGE
ncbi:MAG: hypothetical protein PHC46_05115 [Clostridia bacterium]|nr:hypothetical protein [Clostridia bacterium]